MSEENKDLKTEEKEITLPEVDLPGNKPESKEDDTSKTDIDLAAENARVLEELNRVSTERDNYKQGMLTAKEELKKYKKPEDNPDDKSDDKPKDDVSKSEDKKEETTKADGGYNPEKEAIAQFKQKHPDVDIKEILGYYRGAHGKDTVTGIVTDLEEALEYRKFKANDTGSSGNYSQGGGVSETENKPSQKITSEDIRMADKYFNGDVQRYLKNKDKN